MAADNIISIKEATIAIAIIAMATIVMATIAAIITTVAQTRETYKKATVKIKKDIKASNRRNTMSATNQNAGLTNIP
jgi:hypothetical protein